MWILAACGDDPPASMDSLLGTFSSSLPGVSGQQLAVFRYDIREDGTLVYTESRCGSAAAEPRTYPWEPRGQDEIEVLLPEPVLGNTAWRISRGEDCNDARIEFIQGDTVAGVDGLHRGEICLQDLGPCPSGSECDDCKTAWCDAEPPSCDE